MNAPFDQRMMGRALALASQGTQAHPNPRVGCVLVQGTRVVGEGWHERFGGPHAEVNALRRAGRRSHGATLYVTLEPCPHWGKTPPCVEALVRAGVRRVVVAGLDPHPRRKGKGVAFLRSHGIQVDSGLLRLAAEEMNVEFFSRLRRGRPWVTLKMAQTLDGKIASCRGVSRWITGPQARKWVHRRRARADAVLVGGETVRRDNPLLTTHGAGPNPVRVILSGSLHLPPTARIFDSAAPRWILSARPPLDRRRRLEKAGAVVLDVGRRAGRVDLPQALSALSQRGVGDLLVEGGGATAAEFLQAGLVDEVAFFIAPFLMGGATAPTSVEGLGWPRPADGPRLKNVTLSQLGRDILVQGRL